MKDLLKIQQKLIPQVIELMERRYSILRQISLSEPVGRRTLSNILDISERVVRSETEFLKEQGLICDRSKQTVEDILVLPRDYFYPKRLDVDRFLITDNTLGIHRCSNSWMSSKQIARGNSLIWAKIIRPTLNALRSLGQKIIGKERIRTIEIYIRHLLK